MAKRYTYATHLECSATGERYDIAMPQNLSKAGKPHPRAGRIGDFLMLNAIRESKGFALAVDDADILEAVSHVAGRDGFLLSPEGATTYVAYRTAAERGMISPTDKVILLNCATGLKYPMPPADARIDIRQDVDIVGIVKALN